MDLAQVILYTVLTILATGLGALPFFFKKELPAHWLGTGTALAAGAMIGAGMWLVLGGWEISVLLTLLGVLAGVLFLKLTQKALGRYPNLHFSRLPGAGARQMFLIIIVMTVHSMAEGVGIGVAFGNGLSFGIVVALALAIHNIPEGLAISLVLVPRGVPAWKAALWSIFSSTTQLLAIPAFLFVQYFNPFLPFGLGFAGGAMLGIVFSDLLPDSVEKLGVRPALLIALAAAISMLLFEFVLGVLGVV